MKGCMKMNRKVIREYLLGDANSEKIEAMCKAKGFRNLESFLRILAGFNKADKGESPVSESVHISESNSH